MIKNGMSTSQRLHEQLGGIIAGTPPGEKLMSEPELAKQLKVSRATLREAMRTFETQGLIYRRQGSGTFVIHPSQVIDSGLEVLESIETLSKRIGLAVTMGDLKIKHCPADQEVAQALSLPRDDMVLHVSRVIHAEGRPVAYLTDILPEGMLTASELETGFTGSVLDQLLKRDTHVFASSRCEINAVQATAEVARALRIQRGDVLLRFIASLYTTNGRVADYSFSYFLPGYFNFHVIRRIG
ncbi:MAG: GntR family transcriptional regulator [Acidobacteriaceae bacterium]